MNTAKKLKLIERVERLNVDLGIEGGVTFDQLKAAIEHYSSSPIEIETSLLNPAIYGACFRSQNSNYVIIYDARLAASEQQAVICHELAHIVRGDTDKGGLFDKAATINMLCSQNIPENLSAGLFWCKVGLASEDEQQVEFIGRRLSQKIVTHQEQQLEKLMQIWLD